MRHLGKSDWLAQVGPGAILLQLDREVRFGETLLIIQARAFLVTATMAGLGALPLESLVSLKSHCSLEPRVA
jgi:hypothetical protein